LAEPVRTIPVEIKNRCGGTEYIESPILFKHGELWYMTYVTENGRMGHNCNYSSADPQGSYIQYAVSRNMFGPFNKDIRHLIYPPQGKGTEGNVHQGVCEYKGQWYIAYHLPSPDAHPAPAAKGMTFSEGLARQATVTKLLFRSDGSLEAIHPEKDPGAGSPATSILTLDAFADKREAQEFHDRENANEEKGIKGEYHFKMKAGGYLKFRSMDFGAGAKGFKVQVSSENAELTNGRLEFRLDSPAGKLIAEAPVKYTRGKFEYVVLAGAARDVLGIYDLYLVARGHGGDASGHLFNIAWFAFTRNGTP